MGDRDSVLVLASVFVAVFERETEARRFRTGKQWEVFI